MVIGKQSINRMATMEGTLKDPANFGSLRNVQYLIGSKIAQRTNSDNCNFSSPVTTKTTNFRSATYQKLWQACTHGHLPKILREQNYTLQTLHTFVHQ